MSILLSLSPFAVFFVLMRLVSPGVGLVGAFLASLVLCLAMRRRGHSVKILEVGSLDRCRRVGRGVPRRRLVHPDLSRSGAPPVHPGRVLKGWRAGS